METFFFVAQIVLGILIVPAIIALIFLLGYIAVGLIEYAETSKEFKVEKMKKQAPYDLVETYIDTPTKTMHVCFWKGDVLVWDGKISDKELK